MERLEQMAEFFAARVDMYDEHMINDVEGCKEGYKKMAGFVPEDCNRLLDLGCGTGLELEGIFRKLPEVSVTGVDLCQEMLCKLNEKYSEKNISLICDDYFTADFGKGFDCAVSFQTMHHFKKDKKLELYRKIYNALTDEGVYIECDYMVESEEEENRWFAENERLRKEQGIGEDEFFHYDTPCTIENQIAMLKTSGFSEVEKVMRIENTTMLVARKV